MGNKATVLVIEDEAVNRRIIRRILEAEYCVLEAENGQLGLALCREKAEEIAAILLDLTMPVMDGYQFMAEITKTGANNTPILVMTGSDDVETEQKALRAGAWDFIAKPYNAAIIHVRLENAISRSKMALFEQVKYLSEHDSLTGLFNRAKMFEESRRLMRAASGQDHVFLCLDFDHFSLYNSSFGEKAGNELLRHFAGMVRESRLQVGPAVFGRITADKFCVCAPFHHNRELLRRYLDEAQAALNEYSPDYLLKLSAGAYIIPAGEAETTDMAEFYLRASIAAQRCKQQFDSILEFYDESVRRQMDKEVEITNEMRTALQQEQFVVYFQPKYRVTGDVPCGAEALVRWKHPTKGMISPGEFIPVFEKNGFISKVDYYVWEHTCRRLRKWMDAGQTVMPVSVNLSRVSLYNRNLDVLLTELVGRYRVPPALLELEITESAYMTSPELMGDLVKKLHAAGFKILMDDFGSDYSSLNALKDIEVDILKIDMAFIPHEKNIEKGEIILASMIKMARWLGMPVIAEGVETRRQRDFLEGTGCDMIQGYFYARPLPPEEYEQRFVYAAPLTSVASDAGADYDAHGLDTVLVIDDSEAARAIVTACIDGCYRVEACACAEDALVYLRRYPDTVKLILVDNIMPGMTGLDFLQFCRNDENLRVIPKIMITVSDRVEDQLAAFEAGAYDFITKPLVPEVVAARVHHVMDTTYHSTTYDRVKQTYAVHAPREPRTGLLTHLAFRELSARMIATFPEDPMAVLLIDLDDFGEVNKTCGYDVGTKILTAIARELKMEFRRSDVVGQICGDEFAVLLCGIPDKKTAKQKSAEVLRGVAFLGAREFGIPLSASIGLVYPVRGDTIDTILAKADQALAEAKSSRKGICVIYGESVPPIRDDGKPIILVCGGEVNTFKELAIAYGDSASFAFVQSSSALDNAFAKYAGRIALLCVDLNTPVSEDLDAFYARANLLGSGAVPMLALCRLGDMRQLRCAVSHSTVDLLPLPIQPDLAQAQLALAIMAKKHRCTGESDYNS